ncbi:MAG: TetR family transcriptional regulator [Tardiphaga sp.]|jgi:AcrR family transcriptional regulator|nr:TetR family transcriptional regulator [Tardiphaga sp.]
MDHRSEKRKRILDAADELFAKFGPTKTSLADIARGAQMSAPNIYNFFESRDAIIEAVGERHLSELQRQLFAEVMLIDGKWDAICHLFLSTAKHLRYRLSNEKDILKLHPAGKDNWEFVERYHDFVVHTVKMFIASGIASGEFAKVDAGEMAKGIFDCMTNAWSPLIVLGTEPKQHERDLHRQFDILRRSLR